MNVVALDSRHRQRAEGRGAIRADLLRLVERAASDAMELLPNVPPHVNIVLSPTTNGETYGQLLSMSHDKIIKKFEDVYEPAISA